MANKIMCKSCNKLNDRQKYCIYCGEKLPVDKKEIKQNLDDPEPYCLNCGRSVNNQICECGYEFGDIKCLQCNTINSYTNKFCTECGNKLWRLNIDTDNISNVHLSDENTFFNVAKSSGWNLEKLQSIDLNLDKNLYEICSRWKIVSPHFCIKCLKTNSQACGCIDSFLTDKNRINFIQREKNNYIEPVFDIADSKLTSKYKNEKYFLSLAPSPGESQLEYIERLKREFSRNIICKKKVKHRIESMNSKKPKHSLPDIDNDDELEGDWTALGITQDEWERNL